MRLEDYGSGRAATTAKAAMTTMVFHIVATQCLRYMAKSSRHHSYNNLHSPPVATGLAAV
jgi:hypothetical protein